MEITPPADTVQCSRCKRTLRAASSIARRIGRHCRALAAAEVAAQADITPEQAEKALQLINDGGLVPLGRAGVYQAVPSSGTGTYWVSVNVCSCPAGQRRPGAKCYHRAAVIALTARPAVAVLAASHVELAA
jgi:hypothetical protein